MFLVMGGWDGGSHTYLEVEVVFLCVDDQVRKVESLTSHFR